MLLASQSVILASGSWCTSGEQYQSSTAMALQSSALGSQNGHLPHLRAGHLSIVCGSCSSAGSVVILRFHPLYNYLVKDGRLLLKYHVAPLCQKKQAHSFSLFSHPQVPWHPGIRCLQFFRIPLQHGTQMGHHSSCGSTCSKQSLICRPLFLM